MRAIVAARTEVVVDLARVEVVVESTTVVLHVDVTTMVQPTAVAVINCITQASDSLIPA